MLNDSGNGFAYALAPVLPTFAFLGKMSAVGMATSAAYSDVTRALLDDAERDGN